MDAWVHALRQETMRARAAGSDLLATVSALQVITGLRHTPVMAELPSKHTPAGEVHISGRCLVLDQGAAHYCSLEPTPRLPLVLQLFLSPQLTRSVHTHTCSDLCIFCFSPAAQTPQTCRSFYLQGRFFGGKCTIRSNCRPLCMNSWI